MVGLLYLLSPLARFLISDYTVYLYWSSWWSIWFNQMLVHHWMNWFIWGENGLTVNSRDWYPQLLQRGKSCAAGHNTERSCRCQLASCLIPTCVLSRDELPACVTGYRVLSAIGWFPVEWEHMKDSLNSSEIPRARPFGQRKKAGSKKLGMTLKEAVSRQFSYLEMLILRWKMQGQASGLVVWINTMPADSEL